MIPVQLPPHTSAIAIEHIEQLSELVFNNEPHTHNFFEIGYFENGEGMHTIDFINYPIQKFTVYFLQKSNVHTMLRQPGSFGKVLLFSENNLKDLALLQKLYFAQPQIQLDEQKFKIIKSLFEQIEDAQNTNSHAEALVAAYLQLILTFYISHAAKQDGYHEKIIDFISYVEKNYSAKLSVEDCLAAIRMSYQQLHAEVHKKMNKNPIDIIKERIILQAKRLLFNTEKSIKEIAYSLDFEDASYFSKYFKSNTGSTPGEFRIQSRM
jgi:AraC-like DNA-binding protein